LLGRSPLIIEQLPMAAITAIGIVTGVRTFDGIRTAVSVLP
jgi:hypothetical protein